MNILIFKTTNGKRLDEILERMDRKKNRIFLVLPYDEAEIYRRKYKTITIIKTGKRYMDYCVLKKENGIPKVCFDEVWIPSSFTDDFFSFGDVYATLTELRYKKMIWIGADNHQITIKCSMLCKIRDAIYYIISQLIFFIAKTGCLINSIIKGYRW